MADLDRVILALGCSIPGRDMPEDCPCEFRESGGDCTSRVAEAAINLLKEQEQTIEALKEKLRLLEYGNHDLVQDVLMPAT